MTNIAIENGHGTREFFQLYHGDIPWISIAMGQFTGGYFRNGLHQNGGFRLRKITWQVLKKYTAICGTMFSVVHVVQKRIIVVFCIISTPSCPIFFRGCFCPYVWNNHLNSQLTDTFQRGFLNHQPDPKVSWKCVCKKAPFGNKWFFPGSLGSWCRIPGVHSLRLGLIFPVQGEVFFWCCWWWWWLLLFGGGCW